MMFHRFRAQAPVGLFAALFATLSFTSFAAEEKDGAIFVTDTRTAKTADQSLAAVTLVTRDDIERSQAKNVAELLAGEAGVDFTINGGYGKTTSLFLRGTNSEHVLVLIDGMRVGSATLGSYSWEFLPLDQIERIEIVRGPRASLYGSDAIGGVVQIFTRDPKPGANAKASGGTYSTRDGALTVSGASGETGYSLSAARFSTDGINATTPDFPFGHNPDDDGYANDSVSARVSHKLGAAGDLHASLFRTSGRTDYDGSFVNQTDFVQQVATVGLTMAPVGIWALKVNAGHSRDDSDNALDGALRSVFNTDRDSITIQNDLAYAGTQLTTLGLDWYEDRINSTTSFAELERYNRALFVQHQAGFGAHDLLVSLRDDNNEAFGNHVTGNAAWGIGPESLRTTLSYGTAFKAPSFNQLYFPGFGNPLLQPEESESYELGFRAGPERLRTALSLYQTNTENLIVFDLASFTLQNIGRGRVRGVELEETVKLGQWIAALRVTRLDPRNRDNDNLLPRRAKRLLRLDVDTPIGPVKLGIGVLGESKRYDNASNTVELAGFWRLDLRARWDISKAWYLAAKLNNVLDEDYQTVATYNSAGRNALLTVGWQGQP